ncbi:hypothetical protein QYE76_019099 [Lolium multiflorum]|uniref:Transposase (putative) gypsy type domain-containing protein n=1 Tax=Lolium multiflorum TaxID=4521 RepID=A0AAD8R3D0_LOLMU|nr:hypothetical protein QYE76_019099 [Lolium multiflorum]
MLNPGGYALILDLTLVGPEINVKFSKVLIDNGSSINIMYRDTMSKLGISENMLEPSRTTFHGIVLGVSCAPMGKVQVDVLFGIRENCWVENILFEVVDLNSPYHALLGRPALAKFMATTHVSYLKMKMLGPNGIITVAGSYKRSLECVSAGSSLAEALVIAEEKKRTHVVVVVQSCHAGMPNLLRGRVLVRMGWIPDAFLKNLALARVSGVTSLRLLRQHLWRHTGSSLPFRIRVASLWLSVFRACTIAPRGGPRGEPSWPSGCRPTTSSLYLRGERFLPLFFSALTTSHAPRALARCALATVVRRLRSSLRRTSAAIPPCSAAQRLSAAPSLLPRRASLGDLCSSSSPFISTACNFAASPATVILNVFRRLSMSSEAYLSDSAGSSHHSGASDGLEVELDQMNASSSAPEAGTGRGQEASSSSQASGANLVAITRGTWKGSDVKQPEIDWLYRSRRIPAQVSCRIPRGEVEPAPEPGEYVVFSAHFERGFGLPASDFFREFLDFYELQPHHLPGNAIFYLSCFVSFMEAYIGLCWRATGIATAPESSFLVTVKHSSVGNPKRKV